jgi:exodeoxyribonuclease VII large subunit
LLRNNVERRRERYDNLIRRLGSGLASNAEAHRVRLSRHRDRVVVLHERAQRATLALLKYNNARVDRAAQLLTAFSYREVLKRGFALVRDGEGYPLRSAAAVGSGSRLDIEFADGRVAAVADGESVARPAAAPPKPAAKSAPKPRTREDPGQGGLFD